MSVAHTGTPRTKFLVPSIGSITHRRWLWPVEPCSSPVIASRERTRDRVRRMEDMEINGLPLHPLVVHAAVVFGPLAAVAALGYLVPRWRDHLRWPMVVLAVVATGAIVVAYLSGGDFLDSKPELSTSPLVQEHEQRAKLLLWTTLAFGVVALVAGWLHSRTGAVRVVIDVLLGVLALAVLVLVVRTGDAGARAVWG